MIKNPVSIEEHKTAYDAIKLMKDNRVDTLFVTDIDNHLTGVVEYSTLAELDED